MLFLDEKLVFINIGDSRAIISRKNGQEICLPTNDHKPHLKPEMRRIFNNKGCLYRVSNKRAGMNNEIFLARNELEFDEAQLTLESDFDRQNGPWRVKPGGLSVGFH